MESERNALNGCLTLDSTEVGIFEPVGTDMLKRNGGFNMNTPHERKGESEACRNNNPSCRKTRETTRQNGPLLAEPAPGELRRSQRIRRSTRTESEQESEELQPQLINAVEQMQRNGLHERHSKLHLCAGTKQHADVTADKINHVAIGNGISLAADAVLELPTAVNHESVCPRNSGQSPIGISREAVLPVARVNNAACISPSLDVNSVHSTDTHLKPNGVAQSTEASTESAEVASVGAQDMVDHMMPVYQNKADDEMEVVQPQGTLRVDTRPRPAEPETLHQQERRVAHQTAQCIRLQTFLRAAQLQLMCNQIFAQLGPLRNSADSGTSPAAPEAAPKQEASSSKLEVPKPTSMRTRSCGAVSPITDTRLRIAVRPQKPKTKPNSISSIVVDTIDTIRSRTDATASTSATPAACSNVNAPDVRTFAMRTEQLVRNITRACDPELTESSSDDEDDADFDDVDWAAQALARVPTVLTPSCINTDSRTAQSALPVDPSEFTARPDAATSCWPYAFVETRVSIERRLKTKANWLRRRTALLSRARCTHSLKLTELDEQLQQTLAYYARLRAEKPRVVQHSAELDDPEASTYATSRCRPITSNSNAPRRFVSLARDHAPDLDDESDAKSSRRVAERLARLSRGSFHSQLSVYEDAPRSLLRTRDAAAFERGAYEQFVHGAPQALGARRRVSKQTMRNAALIQERLDALGAASGDTSMSPRRRRHHYTRSHPYADANALTGSQADRLCDAAAEQPSALAESAYGVTRRRQPKRRASGALSDAESLLFHADLLHPKRPATNANNDSQCEDQPVLNRSRPRRNSVQKNLTKKRLQRRSSRWRKKRRNTSSDWRSDATSDTEQQDEAGSDEASSAASQEASGDEANTSKPGDRSRSASAAQDGAEKRRSAVNKNRSRRSVAADEASTVSKPTSYDNLRSSLMKTQDYLVDYSIGSAVFPHVHIEPEARLDIPTPSWRMVDDCGSAPDAPPTECDATALHGDLDTQETREFEEMNDESYLDRHDRAEKQERLRYDSIVQRHSTQRRSRLAVSDKSSADQRSDPKATNLSEAGAAQPDTSVDDAAAAAAKCDANANRRDGEGDPPCEPTVNSQGAAAGREDADTDDKTAGTGTNASSLAKAGTSYTSVCTATEVAEPAAATGGAAGASQPNAMRRRFTRVRTIEYVRNSDPGWPARTFPLNSEQLDEMVQQDNEARDPERIAPKCWRAVAERLAELRRSMRCGASQRRRRRSGSQPVQSTDAQNCRSRNADDAEEAETETERCSRRSNDLSGRSRLARTNRVVLNAHRQRRPTRRSLDGVNETRTANADDASSECANDSRSKLPKRSVPRCVVRQVRTQMRRPSRGAPSTDVANVNMVVNGIRPRMRPLNMHATSMRVHPANVLRLGSQEVRRRRDALVRRSAANAEHVMTQLLNASASALPTAHGVSNANSAPEECHSQLTAAPAPTEPSSAPINIQRGFECEANACTPTSRLDVSAAEREKTGLVLRLKVRASTANASVSFVAADRPTGNQLEYESLGSHQLAATNTSACQLQYHVHVNGVGAETKQPEATGNSQT